MTQDLQMLMSDGMDDDSETTPVTDSDEDGTPDYQDIDSDNDGIFDVVEGGDGELRY